ncbi:MAG: putative Branchpoint-bridging protein [Streblomastix strix]|uniref:Branchpoint-bridging protein n=1 Tax=Streblomastix strix TaxID=222440 RepID=A0A5J4WHG7_9EUKA|nr:MAG: putative Branchpoint-bridging protein [Streblomastix strix]
MSLKSTWGPHSNQSRWGTTKLAAPFVPGTPMHIDNELTRDALDILILKHRLRETAKRLETNDFEGEPVLLRQEFAPIYNESGMRIHGSNENTRIRLQVEKDSIEEVTLPKNPLYNAQPLVQLKTGQKRQQIYFLPESSDPTVNVLGLVIGPGGATLKEIELNTRTKIIIRGRGSKQSKKDTTVLPGDDDDLHALIQGDSDEDIRRAKETIRDIIESKATQQDFRKQQLRQLAKMHGTLKDEGPIACEYCGSQLHVSSDCDRFKDKRITGVKRSDISDTQIKDTKVENKNAIDKDIGDDDDVAQFVKTVGGSSDNDKLRDNSNDLSFQSSEGLLPPPTLPGPTSDLQYSEQYPITEQIIQPAEQQSRKGSRIMPLDDDWLMSDNDIRRQAEECYRGYGLGWVREDMSVQEMLLQKLADITNVPQQIGW